MLLNVRQLLESSIAVSAFVRFLSGVHANVLDQLVIAAEAFETLLALVWFDVAANAATGCRWTVTLDVARMLHLHSALVHENLRKKDARLMKQHHMSGV